jgi:hypothetical protein
MQCLPAELSSRDIRSFLAYEGVDEEETIINADDDKSSIKGIKIMLMNKIFV